MRPRPGGFLQAGRWSGPACRPALGVVAALVRLWRTPCPLATNTPASETAWRCAPQDWKQYPGGLSGRDVRTITEGAETSLGYEKEGCGCDE